MRFYDICIALFRYKTDKEAISRYDIAILIDILMHDIDRRWIILILIKTHLAEILSHAL